MPGGPRIPGGFGSVRLPERADPRSGLSPEERSAAALEALAEQLTNAPVHLIVPISLAAGGTQLIDSNQQRVNTLTVTVTAGMIDLYYGDQGGNMSPQPHERFYQNTTMQLKIPPNKWTLTACAGAGLAAAGCVKLSWTNN